MDISFKNDLNSILKLLISWDIRLLKFSDLNGDLSDYTTKYFEYIFDELPERILKKIEYLPHLEVDPDESIIEITLFSKNFSPIFLYLSYSKEFFCSCKYLGAYNNKIKSTKDFTRIEITEILKEAFKKTEQDVLDWEWVEMNIRHFENKNNLPKNKNSLTLLDSPQETSKAFLKEGIENITRFITKKEITNKFNLFTLEEIKRDLDLNSSKYTIENKINSGRILTEIRILTPVSKSYSLWFINENATLKDKMYVGYSIKAEEIRDGLENLSEDLLTLLNNPELISEKDKDEYKNIALSKMELNNNYIRGLHFFSQTELELAPPDFKNHKEKKEDSINRPKVILEFEE